jgi:hypothetical protein
MNYTALLPTSSNEITRHNHLLLINANNKIKIDCALTKISKKIPMIKTLPCIPERVFNSSPLR